MIDDAMIKRLAIQCGVFERFEMDSDMEHPQTAGDMDCLAKFAQACYAAGQDEIQAELDRVMLEFCSDEMTEAQVERWKNSQRPEP